MTTRCDVPGCTNEPIMQWRPIGHDRVCRVCQQHADRHHDRSDGFDLREVFGLDRNASRPTVVSDGGFQRFPDFGKELRRPCAVAEQCYDCAAFFEGCPAWPASKKFACAHYEQLPDVMPGTYGQTFPEKVFVPTAPLRSSGGADPPRCR